ncbi:PucR family transcriptional regulator [Rhodococcus erythropolis]|uniref:PucR family transcriptional regulator n=1 Tax=Rhodococcus erythropolis TaxID=1833 RepID=UPI0037AD821C
MSDVRGTSANLGMLVDRLGSTLLTLKAGPHQSSRTVSSVILHDPLDPPDVVPDAVVLGVSVAAGNEDFSAFVSAAADAGAAALVIREPVVVDDAVEQAAERGNISIFGLVRGASWIQVAALVGGALNLDADGDPVDKTDSSRDLFTLANSVSALLSAPVTIEDLSSRVIAFSADQAGTDEPRRLTILGLQVPDLYTSSQREQGVFPHLYASDRPVFMQNPAPGTLPRVAMRVQAGDEVLGSIWAIVPEPLTPDQEQGMAEASQVVALAMLRARVSADTSRRRGEHLTTMLFEGGSSAREAAQQLTFGSSPACVLVFGPLRSGEELRMSADIQRASFALRMHLRSTYPRAIAEQLGGVIYAVIPVQSADDHALAAIETLATNFISHLNASTEFCAGLGRIVTNITELSVSRRDADTTMRVLRSRPHTSKRVARAADVQIDALMLHISDSIAADGFQLGGPLTALVEYDDTHGTQLVESLDSWLEHFGDVAAAAKTLHVHKNTFRYRLERIEKIAEIALDNPDVRFGLMLQLRLLAGGSRYAAK